MPDFIINELNYQNAVDRYLLIPLEKADLGSEPEIEADSIRIYLGSKPICVNLLGLYLKQGKQIPAELSIFDQYDIWMVTYGVSIIRSGGWKKLSQVGLEINYPAGEDDPSVVIIKNMPETSFKKIMDGKLVFDAGLELNGQLSAKIDKFKVEEYIDLGFGGKLNVSSAAKASFNIAFSLLSEKIISIGTGDTHGEWVMHKDAEPLLGDQLFSQTILAPKGLPRLSVKARVSSVITGPMGSFPVKMHGEWNELALKMV